MGKMREREKERESERRRLTRNNSVANWISWHHRERETEPGARIPFQRQKRSIIRSRGPRDFEGGAITFVFGSDFCPGARFVGRSSKSNYARAKTSEEEEDILFARVFSPSRLFLSDFCSFLRIGPRQGEKRSPSASIAAQT